jgi:alpha-L-rhamnosidase
MTSFNHYALGAVATFLHNIIAGLKPLEPGYRRFSIQPLPGGTITQASAHTITPYGKVGVSWSLASGRLSVDFEVPPNTEAVVQLGGKEEIVGSGKYNRTVQYIADGEWPPAPYQTQFATPPTLETLAL